MEQQEQHQPHHQEEDTTMEVVDENQQMTENKQPAGIPAAEDHHQEFLDDETPDIFLTAAGQDDDDLVEVQGLDEDAPMEEEEEEEEGVTITTEDQSKVQLSSHAPGPVYCLVAHVDAARGGRLTLVSGGGDDKAFLHILGGGEPSSKTSIPLSHTHFTDSVSSVALNLPYRGDDDKTPPYAAVGAYDGSLVIYNPTSTSTDDDGDGGGQLLQTLEGPTDGVECLAWHPVGGSVLLAGSSTDGTLWMYHVPMKKCLQVFVGHQAGSISAVSFTPNGKLALSASSDGTLRVWAPRTGVCKHVFSFASSLGGHDETTAAGLTCLATNGGTDGHLVIVGAEDGQAHVCHVPSKKVVASLRHYQVPPNNNNNDDEELDLPMSVEAVGFCPSNPNWCATGGVDGVLKIWDLAANQGQCRQECRVVDDEKAGGGITRLTWHPTLPLVFTSCTNGSVYLWDARNGGLLQSLTGGTMHVLNDLAVVFADADGADNTAKIITASDDGVVRLFEINNLRQLMQQQQQQ